MGKIFGFFILWRLLGNPIIAIIVLLAILYLIDRRFIGLFPSITKPFSRLKKVSKLRNHIALSPNDISSKHDLARLLMERKKYKEALTLLESIERQSEESAEYWDDRGTATIRLGRIPEGEAFILRALSINPRVKYGQPYLVLADAFKHSDHNKAMSYVQQFQQIQNSSSEGYYLLGQMYKTLGREEEAKAAFQESISNYRSLPKYRKRQERRWALLSLLNKR